jgi:hypothetical protein
LSNLADIDVIISFISGTMSETLVHKLGCKSPHTTKKLLDITTNHAWEKTWWERSLTIAKRKPSATKRPTKKMVIIMKGRKSEINGGTMTC